EYIRQVQKSIVQYFFAEKIRLISEFNYLKHQYEKKDEEHKSYSIYWVLFVLKNEIEEYPPDMSDYNEDGVLVDIFFSTFRIIEDMIVIYKEKPYRYDTYQENQKNY